MSTRARYEAIETSEDGMEDDGAGRSRSRWGTYLERTTRAQLLLVALIGFCCPGMLNALNGMGGGGNVDSSVAAHANAALTATSAFAYVLIGVPLFEIYGMKSASMGCWTYALYALGLLWYAQTEDGMPVILSGAILGIGSALYWLVQGAIMISYPTVERKGRAIASFWVIFNLGGMVGALLACFQTWRAGSDQGTLSFGSYFAIAFIMILGEGLSFFILPPSKVRRRDGSFPEYKDSKSMKEFGDVVKREIKHLLAIRHEKRVVLLIPMFVAANWFYSYQQNVMNGESFDLSGRAFNSALYWAAQILGGLLIPLITDLPPYSTRTRAVITWSVLFIFGNMVMIKGHSFELLRESKARGWIRFGWEEEYLWAAELYFAYGLLDALWQGVCYWLLGIASSNTSAASKLVAIYKLSQCAGASVAYWMTGAGVSGYIQFLSNWIMVTGTLFIALPAVLAVRETEVDLDESGYQVIPSTD